MLSDWGEGTKKLSDLVKCNNIVIYIKGTFGQMVSTICSSHKVRIISAGVLATVGFTCCGSHLKIISADAPATEVATKFNFFQHTWDPKYSIIS